MKTEAALHPVHHTVRKLRFNRVPLGMDGVVIDAETLESLQRVALDIFARGSNHGHSFADALTWVYLSGMEHAISASTDRSQAPSGG